MKTYVNINNKGLLE